ncbi:SGNH/GDSL hydrolase family protein [Gammaproteobacteria bacterium]|nr:SGNH/GDSL hydrolase family protein [Gammaproteobacteria bacterium]
MNNRAQLKLFLVLKIFILISALFFSGRYIQSKFDIIYKWSGFLPDRIHIFPKIIDRRPQVYTLVSMPENNVDAECGSALIIGDSIAYGYLPYLRENLKMKYNIYMIPDNGRSTSYSLKRIDQWLESKSYDLILANWGLWDILRLDLPFPNKIIDQSTFIVTSQQDYAFNLELLHQKLTKYSDNISFINTTPTLLNKVRKPEDVKAYNETMKNFSELHAVELIDLFSFAKINIGQELYIDKVHFNKVGSQKIARYISGQLPDCKR